MKDKILTVVIPTSGAPFMKVLPNTLEAFQEEVDGYIEVVPLGTGALMVLNEEGKLRGLDYNCEYFGDELCGNIVIVGEDGGDFADCPQIFIDMFNLIHVGWSYLKLNGVDFVEPFRASSVTLALEAMRNTRGA